ncbi:MAG: hypothetical protein IJW67_08530 [Blautia sp.]|nr:hypothetical protein [Blautia sp.]
MGNRKAATWLPVQAAVAVFYLPEYAKESSGGGFLLLYFFVHGAIIGKKICGRKGEQDG